VAGDSTPYAPRRAVLRGALVPADAFVILWSGGYNTWSDVEGLFAALEEVMAACADVHFVSTGGSLAGHDDLSYGRLQRLAAGSAHVARYHLQGWVTPDDLPAYYLESDVAVCADRLCYEASLGSRTRALDWLRAGLPCVLSAHTEVAAAIAAHGAGLTYAPGDSADLARCLRWCLTHRAALKPMGEVGQRLLQQHYNYESTAAPLLRWAAAPTRAPDSGHAPRLIRPAHTLLTHLIRAVRTGRLSFSLALRLWPIVAALMPAAAQRQLAALGLRLLRLPR
jgi:glycosyltransferase involved in cell wall biosynthesis